MESAVTTDPAMNAARLACSSNLRPNRSEARPNSGIVEVNGNMVLETVDSCDGWEIKQRIKLTFLRSDGEEFETDSSFTSYESKDGLQLRFSVRNAQNDEVEEEPDYAPVDIEAEADAGDDVEGARLIALNMALNGQSREETDRYLAENFDLSDRGRLLDEVYSSVES